MAAYLRQRFAALPRNPHNVRYFHLTRNVLKLTYGTQDHKTYKMFHFANGWKRMEGERK